MRRRSGRPSGFGPRATFRKRKKKKTLNVRVRKIERKLKKEEFKNFQVEGTINPDNTLTLATNVVHLTPIPQSTAVVDSHTRVGRKISIKSIDFKGILLGDITTPRLLRIVIFWARDVNATLPVGDQILDNSVTAKWIAHREKDSQNDFMVHYDKTHLFNNDIAGSPRHKLMRKYKRLNHVCTWDESTTLGTIGSSRDGHWFLLALGTQATAANNPELTYICRFHYTDL